MPIVFGGIFDYPLKQERLEEVRRELEDSAIWSDPARAQTLGKERVQLERVVNTLDKISRGVEECDELLTLAAADNDVQSIKDIAEEVQLMEQQVAGLEFQRMFSGELDECNAYLDVQSGSGGTEAQDWAEMLLRMYLRWGERKGFTVELLEVSAGEVAGIKSATVHFLGPYAYGWLRTETGVHRLVRKSPFDSGNRRHTSFASIFVSPEIDDSIDITVNPADLRVDTYRASGAGGQHINRTDSAVRLTHIPTGIVVQCQSDRSQHKNRAQAMSQMRAKLYELERQKRSASLQVLEDSKADISWGSQIRSYILDDARVKDLRTGVETGNPQPVLDGDLDKFIEASLQAGL